MFLLWKKYFVQVHHFELYTFLIPWLITFLTLSGAGYLVNVAAWGGSIQPGSWKTPPAVDMNLFLHTLLEIHIFKATMQSFSSLALKTWM